MATAQAKKPAAKAAEQKVEKTYTKEELDALVKAAVAEALKGAEKGGEERIVQVNREEMLTVYFFGVVAPGTSVKLGDLGIIPRAGTPLEISKKDFFKGMSLAVTKLLESRLVVVANGLTDEERVRYGLDYADGEVLTQRDFFNITNYGAKELAEKYKKLCHEHKKVVVDLFADDLFEHNGAKATPEKIKALRKISNADAPDLLPIIELILERLGKNAMAED